MSNGSCPSSPCKGPGEPRILALSNPTKCVLNRILRTQIQAGSPPIFNSTRLACPVPQLSLARPRKFPSSLRKCRQGALVGLPVVRTRAMVMGGGNGPELMASVRPNYGLPRWWWVAECGKMFEWRIREEGKGPTRMAVGSHAKQVGLCSGARRPPFYLYSSPKHAVTSLVRTVTHS